MQYYMEIQSHENSFHIAGPLCSESMEVVASPHRWSIVLIFNVLPVVRAISQPSSRFTDGRWWRHQMETFSALLAICAGNSPVPMNSPHKGQWRGALMFWCFDVDLSLNERLSKQSRGWWFETQSRPLWRHCNDKYHTTYMYSRYTSQEL